MATNYVVGQVTNFITNKVNLLTDTITSKVAEGTSYVASGLNTAFAFNMSANFTTGVSVLGSQIAVALPASVQEYFNIGTFAPGFDL